LHLISYQYIKLTDERAYVSFAEYIDSPRDFSR